MAVRFIHPWFFLLLFSLPAVYVLFRRFAKKTTPAVDAMRIGARLLGITAIIVALTSPQASLEADRVNVFYVVDLSDSMGTSATESAIEYISLTSRQKKPSDTYGIVVFGADASPELLPTTTRQEIGVESVVDSSGTDIEEALYRAVSLFPETGENRIVLLSDGNETSGDARAAARALKSMNIQVLPVAPDRRGAGNEVLIQEIIAPPEVNAGQVHDITVLVQSEDSTEALLYIFRDGVYLGEDSLELSPGANSFTYNSRIDESGAHAYEVYIQPEEDTVPENNQHSAPIRVLGEPTVLYVSDDEEESTPFTDALATQSINTVTIGVEDLPADLQSLLSYDALILDNVPAFDLSIAAMELIERYVKDTGSGLLMLGGDQSFGVGGYFSTPVEKALPVDMDVTSSMNIPSLALFMVVDKSGSMGDTIASGETKLDLVKEAVIASIEVLNPFYTVALLAFDADFEWTVPPTNAGSRQEIIGNMEGLAAGGGTHLYPALAEAYRRLEDTQAAVKHVLVLSDGLTDEGDFEQLAAAMKDDKITLSTVSIGGDSDRELLSLIADVGGGRSYFTDDIERIPRIFASESIIISRGLIVEEPFFPMAGAPSELLEGLDFTTAPPVRGFVLTYPKAGAQTVLSAFNNNPLLSTWRYGLGRSAAYTSDFKGKWGADMIGWDEFPVFAAQLVRWLRRRPGNSELSFTIDKSGVLEIDALDVEGNYLNGLDLQAIILLPDGTSVSKPVHQSAPGLYTLPFETGLAGDYYITVYGEGAGRSFPPETRTITIPYPAEYVQYRPDTDLLDEIALLTGGTRQSAGPAQGDMLFARSGNAQPAYSDFWRLLALAAILLFLVDIALRQVLHSRQEEERKDKERIVGRIRQAAELRTRLTYDELLEHLQAERRREAEERNINYWFGSRNKTPDTTLRLYLARKRRG